VSKNPCSRAMRPSASSCTTSPGHWQLLVHGGAERSSTYPHEHPSPGVRGHPRHAARASAAMLALLRETVG
jgi:hypothetical protein